MRCSPDDDINTVKRWLKDMEGYPPDQQVLIYQGRRLEDAQTLRYYNIQKVTILPYTCVICFQDG